MILLSSPGGAAIVCPVCGSELALPHACTRFPSPPAASAPDSAQRADVTAPPSAGSSSPDRRANDSDEIGCTDRPTVEDSAAAPGDRFTYPNPMWGDTRPGAGS